MTLIGSPTLRVAAPRGSARLFAAPGPSLAEHLSTFGELPNLDGGRLLAEVEASGLAGRGGAGFPTWRKLAAGSANADNGAPIVIGNGAEGEPLSSKDATLLRHAPHLVLDGLLLAGRAVGATELRLAVPGPQLAAVRTAMAERPDTGGITVTETAGTFLSGEASAVVHQIEAGRPVPRDHPLRLTVSGLRGRPTVVHNVETLAHLAMVSRFGAAWFRSVGTADDPGTRLVSVAGDVPTACVLEVVGGAPIASVLRAAGADPDSLRAVLVGGYHGSWLNGADLGLPLSPVELAARGGHPGAGILFALRRGRCGVLAGAEIAGYLAAQSARQCGPCANGLPRIATVLERLASGSHSPGLDAEVRRLADSVAGRGACHHPDGTAKFVLSSLAVFATDVERHLHGECEEGR